MSSYRVVSAFFYKNSAVLAKHSALASLEARFEAFKVLDAKADGGVFGSTLDSAVNNALKEIQSIKRPKGAPKDVSDVKVFASLPTVEECEVQWQFLRLVPEPGNDQVSSGSKMIASYVYEQGKLVRSPVSPS